MHYGIDSKDNASDFHKLIWSIEIADVRSRFGESNPKEKMVGRCCSQCERLFSFERAIWASLNGFHPLCKQVDRRKPH
jgi:hypothetical protein